MRHPNEHTEGRTVDQLFLALSAEEIGKVAVMIIKEVEREQAIPMMPRYNVKQHRLFAGFYDQLQEAMTRALGEG